MHYLATLNSARVILWCYFIWYLTTAARCFDPAPGLWLTSVGLSGIIGFGLLLSTAHAGSQRTALNRWQVLRLFLMPFCVSSFAALVKDKNYVLIFSPDLLGNVLPVALCLAFVLLTWITRRAIKPESAST